jgi:dTDP-4-amino-4,6-dideoxygalactose transaminase
MIRFGSLDFHDEEKQAIEDVISQKEPQLTMGKKVYEFEQSFAKWLGVKHAVMVNSGTSALMVALQADNEVGGHDLITSALTYPADWNALRTTSTPFNVQDVGNDLVVHENKHSVKDHLAVHLLGKPCRVNAIIEDCAEALGSSINGKKLGSFGLLSVFSLYVAHAINTIEGGMVATNNDKLYDICRSLRDNGRICTCPVCTLKSTGVCTKRYSSESIERRWEVGTSVGYNYKPTEIQGALGLVKMKHVDEICKRRNEIFLRYSDAFKNFKQESDEYIVSIAYPVEVKDPQKTIAKLEKDGIECRGMFPAYSSFQKNAYRINQTHILLPLQQEMTDKDVDYVIESVKKCQ